MLPAHCPVALLKMLAVPLVPLLAAGCGEGTAQTRAAPPVPVLAAEAIVKTMPVELRAIGHVEAFASVAVRARVGGELTKVWFTEGQNVQAGETVFTIDERPYRAALRQAEAQVVKDKAMLVKAEADIKRYADLVKDDFVTKEQYDLIQANAESLRGAVAADEANVESARLQLEYCTIKAPVAGRTGDLRLKAGNLVNANDDKPLVTLNQIRPIYVSFSVASNFLSEIAGRKLGTLRVAAISPESDEKPHEGVLTFIDNNVDMSTGMILLKATFANEDEALWPGIFVDTVLTLREEPDRIVVPSAAVQTGQQGRYVFVVKSDDTVELRPVKVTRVDKQDAVVESNLAAGEKVVTDGQLRLVPGSRISMKTSLETGSEKRP
jgi:membrane fusion protein, multidrug efflux system